MVKAAGMLSLEATLKLGPSNRGFPASARSGVCQGGSGLMRLLGLQSHYSSADEVSTLRLDESTLPLEGG
jgi:hypothetical protein